MENAQHIKMLEQKLLRSDVRASRAELDALLAEDFTEYGSSGRIWNKTDIIADLISETDGSDNVLSLDDFAAIPLSDDVILTKYLCCRRASSGDILRTSLRSSIWRLKDGRWQIYFHQGTIVGDSQ